MSAIWTPETQRAADELEAVSGAAMRRLEESLAQSLFGDDGDRRVEELRASVLGRAAVPTKKLTGLSAALRREVTYGR